MKTFKVLIPLILLSMVALYFLNKVPNVAIEGDLSEKVLIFGQPNCPHCQTVKKHLDDNNLFEKLPLAYLDLSQNQAYSDLLLEKANICGLDTTNIGVPFYFYQNSCLQGDEPIIEALSQMLQ